MKSPRTGIEGFCGRSDTEARSWMHKPWIQDGKVYATNGHVIIEAPMVPDALLGAVEKSIRSPNNLAKLFAEAFAAPVWRKLPKLPAFDPCPQCNGTGMVPAEWRVSPGEDGCTCDICEGYGETYKRIEVGDTGFCIRYMRLLASFPDVEISPDGMNPCAFRIGSGDFAGRGIVMPMRTLGVDIMSRRYAGKE